MSKKKSRADRSPVETDFVVGANVRRLRDEAQLTLTELAEVLGISHQQLQKYETGANRISAGMLHELARVLFVPVEALFDGSEHAGDEDTDIARARRKCRAIIDRTTSTELLDTMARVIRSI